jgi:hypothetical protein
MPLDELVAAWRGCNACTIKPCPMPATCEVLAEWSRQHPLRSAAPAPAWLGERKAICAACQLRPECALWKMASCGGLCNKPRMSCPADPPRWLPAEPERKSQ